MKTKLPERVWKPFNGWAVPLNRILMAEFADGRMRRIEVVPFDAPPQSPMVPDEMLSELPVRWRLWAPSP